MKTFLVIISILASMIASSAADRPGNPKSTTPEAVYRAVSISWTNELGSTLKITSINPATGAITGTYKSPSGTTGTEYPISGWINSQAPTGGDNRIVVSFSVRWADYGSITSWNGTYAVVNGTPTIQAQWILSRSNSGYAWDHLLIGMDTFTPASP